MNKDLVDKTNKDLLSETRNVSYSEYYEAINEISRLNHRMVIIFFTLLFYVHLKSEGEGDSLATLILLILFFGPFNSSKGWVRILLWIITIPSFLFYVVFK
jgi:hypothetical protein